MSSHQTGPLEPTSSLACQSFEFMPVWDQKVKPACQEILRSPFEPFNVTPVFTAVYRLASNPCTKVPVLIRGSQNERVQTPDTTAQQCLVLYYLLRELLKEHLEKVRDGALKHAFEKPAYSVQFATVYMDEWFKISESLRKLKAVFNYLQNHWTTLHMHNTNIFFNVMSMGFNMWNDLVLGSSGSGQSGSGPGYRNRLTSILTDLYFDKIDDNSIPDYYATIPEGDDAVTPPATPNTTLENGGGRLKTGKRILKDVNSCLVELDLYISHSSYTSVFETPLKERIKQHYSDRLNNYFGTYDLHTSLKKIKDAVDDEEKRSAMSIQSTTIADIRVTMLEVLVVEPSRLKTFLDVAMNNWVVEYTLPNIEALKLLHDLVRHSTKGMEELRKRFTERMYEHGCNKLKEKVSASGDSDPVDFYVADILVEVTERVRTIALEAFVEDDIMKTALTDGVKKLMNENAVADRGQVEQALARHLHRRIVFEDVKRIDQSSAISGSSTALKFDSKTEVTLFLFDYASKRDAFLEQYHYDLSRRLLYLPFVNREIENSIIHKFSNARDYVHRFEKMIAERIETSGMRYDETTPYSRRFLLVAFAHFWPWGHKSNLYIPKPWPASFPELDCVVKPRLPAKTKITDWMPGVSFAIIQTNPHHFKRGGVSSPLPIDIIVSHLQALILLNFKSDKESLISFNAILRKYLKPETVNEKDFNYPYVKNDIAEAVISLANIGIIAFQNNVKVTENDLIADSTNHQFNISLAFNAKPNAASNGSNGTADSVDIFTHQALFPHREGYHLSQFIRTYAREGGASSATSTSQRGAQMNASDGSAGGKLLSEAQKKQLIQIQLVQIVKKAGEITYDTLFDKVKSNLSGRMEVHTADIKGELEKLIEKEYLERGTEPNIIKHVA